MPLIGVPHKPRPNMSAHFNGTTIIFSVIPLRTLILVSRASVSTWPNCAQLEPKDMRATAMVARAVFALVTTSFRVPADRRAAGSDTPHIPSNRCGS